MTKHTHDEIEYLKMKIDDSIIRIKREYDRTGGMIYLAFSGGKDSTVLAELIKMANLPTKIPFVFSDTGVELQATTDFVKSYDYDNIVTIKTELPFGMVLKKYGKPTVSKMKSAMLSTFQRHNDYDLKFARSRILLNYGSQFKLANKHIHMVHPDNHIKYSNKCCDILKKKPFHKYEKENGMKGVYMGIRTSEGGARAVVYNECVLVQQKHGEDYFKSMPIIDWEDSDMDLFIELYNVEISKAYTEYGMSRTGCIGCPFSKNLQDDLKRINQYEPKRYKACLHYFKDVYIQQNVQLDFDHEYTKDYEEFQPILKQRNKEMMEKYRGKVN